MPNTYYLGTPGDSRSTTVLSDLSISGTLDAGVVESAAGVTGTTGDFSSTMSVDGATKTAWIGCAGLTSSSVLTLATVAPLSILTNAADTDMTIGQLRLVFLDSGLSLCYSSGATLYVVNSAASEAQPTT